MRFQLRPDSGLDDLLALPWHRSLSSWDDPRLVDPVEAARLAPPAVADPSGRAIELAGTLVVLRELPLEDAERANRVLRVLRGDGLQVADPVGVVSHRVGPDGELPAVLMTIAPTDPLTHRDALGPDRDPGPVLDAAVGMLVQLHLARFVCRDPSLTRMRFRRDAGRLSATLVDVGAGDVVEELDAAARTADLDAAASAFATGLVAAGVEQADLVAGLHLLRHEVRRRYRALWEDLTREEQIDGPGDAQGADRVRRMNQLGFDVGEIEVTDDGHGLRLGAATLEPGHHRRRLRRLTGLVVQENQARRLLEDIDAFRRGMDVMAGSDEEAEAIAAVRWFAEVFAPSVAAIPAEVRRPGHDDAEVFHEVLEHRYYLSERSGHDVGTVAAVDSYVSEVLLARAAPEPRAV